MTAAASDRATIEARQDSANLRRLEGPRQRRQLPRRRRWDSQRERLRCLTDKEQEAEHRPQRAQYARVTGPCLTNKTRYVGRGEPCWIAIAEEPSRDVHIRPQDPGAQPALDERRAVPCNHIAVGRPVRFDDGCMTEERQKRREAMNRTPARPRSTPNTKISID